MTLRLQGLRRRYGTTVALDGLSLSVPTGTVVGFLGPNGAGKTTAMRAVFGLVSLDAGEVTWQGGPVGPDERRRFGYMPEERGLYPGMLVGEQVEYLARLHGVPADRAARLLGVPGAPRGKHLQDPGEALVSQAPLGGEGPAERDVLAHRLRSAAFQAMLA